MLGLVLLVAGAGTKPSSDWPVLRNQEATRLIGMAVENNDGQRLGKLSNFVLDLRNGEATYAIVATGGFFGIGGHKKISPMEAISLGTSKKGVVSLGIEYRKWPKA
ncbi:MAG TPA: PRC-barrel domain-containing protein, partial [Verrucomicrobiae bacterium]|nr:PRC-barrel domain-containing protein [Verrucomicrobiae bacterium]